MAIAIQTNLVRLADADARRRGLAANEHEIQVPSPRAITQPGETLMDPTVIERYADLELGLRLHEVWGQFCLMQWLFSVKDSGGGVNLADLSAGAAIRCDAVLETRHAELHALLWRIRFEDRRRHDPAYRETASFASDAEVAATIPAAAFSKPIDDCTDEEVLLTGCEHAGMLAALRWVMDPGRNWADPTIMDIGVRPF